MVVLPRSANQTVDEIKCSLHDALCVLSQTEGDEDGSCRQAFRNADEERRRRRALQNLRNERHDRGIKVYTEADANVVYDNLVE